MSEAVDQASGVTVAPPGTLGDEPPKRGGRALAKRQRGVAYGLLAPGTLFLFLAFLVPLALIVYTSLQSGGLLSGGFSFTWEFSNYSSALSDYGGFYWKSLGISATATVFCILAAYPMAYWIAFYAGRWKSTLFFLILVPFFVSFVIRTVQWKFILGDDGLIFGPLKDLGLLPESFRILQTPIAVICGIAYNFLPFTSCRCTSRWSASTSAWSKPPRTCTRRGSRRSARWCCRCRSRACSPRSSSRSCRPRATT